MANDKKQQKSDDYADFLGQKGPSSVSAHPPRAVMRDLVNSRMKLALVYSFGSIAGYFTTLLLCAQCSIGFTPLAWRTAALMQDLNETACALLCGAIFGLGPFMASNVFLSRFEHRFLLFKMTWLPILVPMIASLFMTLIGTPHALLWHGLWILSAMATPYLLEAATAVKLRQGRWIGVSKEAV